MGISSFSLAVDTELVQPALLAATPAIIASAFDTQSKDQLRDLVLYLTKLLYEASTLLLDSFVSRAVQVLFPWARVSLKSESAHLHHPSSYRSVSQSTRLWSWRLAFAITQSATSSSRLLKEGNALSAPNTLRAFQSTTAPAGSASHVVRTPLGLMSRKSSEQPVRSCPLGEGRHTPTYHQHPACPPTRITQFFHPIRTQPQSCHQLISNPAQTSQIPRQQVSDMLPTDNNPPVRSCNTATSPAQPFPHPIARPVPVIGEDISNSQSQSVPRQPSNDSQQLLFASTRCQQEPSAGTRCQQQPFAGTRCQQQPFAGTRCQQEPSAAKH